MHSELLASVLIKPQTLQVFGGVNQQIEVHSLNLFLYLSNKQIKNFKFYYSPIFVQSFKICPKIETTYCESLPK